MSIKVYGSARCSQCAGVKQYLESKGVSFTYHDVLADKDAMAELKQLGIMSIPVIQKGDKTVVGFNMAGLEEVLKEC